MKYSILALTASAVLAATVPSAPWTSLTPTVTLASATTDFPNKFGISVKSVGTVDSAEATSTSINKRDVINQIGDGQIQKQSASSTVAAASVINQIGDGQIQHQTTATPLVASVINQIGDGQIQHQTSAAPQAASVINQIGDGQIQHQTTTTSAAAASVINQIGDGQIQHQTTSTAAASVINQIGDGQIQHQNSTATAVKQISDGQIQASTTSTGSLATSGTDSNLIEACYSDNNLAMTLEGSVLTDSKGRIGAIVANRQFQFDGPPPQAGSIYAAGWSISPQGNLALGDSELFYQCKSGDFYNLYDENVAAQCEPVHLAVIEFVEC